MGYCFVKRCAGGGGSGEVIPDFNDGSVTDFSVYAGAAHEGELELGYSVSQKVALPATTAAYLTSIEDENFIPSNIKKGANIFGLEGKYEGGTALPKYLGEYEVIE